MSHATIDRFLEKYRKQFARTKRTGTVRSKTFLNVIPVKDFTNLKGKVTLNIALLLKLKECQILQRIAGAFVECS